MDFAQLIKKTAKKNGVCQEVAALSILESVHLGLLKKPSRWDLLIEDIKQAVSSLHQALSEADDRD